MAEVKRERKFGLSADEMWKRVGTFTDMSWVPGLEGAESLDGGKRRKFSMGAGASVVEALLEEDERSYTYTIEEGPLPVSNYRSTLSVTPAGDGECVVEWVGTFDPAEGTPAEMGEQIIGIVYDGGLDALEQGLK